MNRKKNILRLKNFLDILEIALSILIIIGIVISVPDLIKYMVSIIISNKDYSYNLYQSFLSHVLLLVIGLEFVAMLISRDEHQIIYIMTMVVARKMLVHGENTTSLFIGVLAIAVLFIVRKYLTRHKILSNAGIAIFESKTNIASVNEHLVKDINTNCKTIGDYIHAMIEKENGRIETGSVVEDSAYVYQIETMEEGDIGLIAIEEKHRG